MADRVLPGPQEASAEFREAVCIDTRKIFDSCRDKDCIEDLRIYPIQGSQTYIDSACSIRPRSAELLFVELDVEEITFNRGYYTVDCKFFYKVKGVAFPSEREIVGLSVFDKRVILFGSEASTKVFSSNGRACPRDAASALPVAVCESVDPINLNMKLVDPHCVKCADPDLREIPDFIRCAFPEDIFLGFAQRQVLVTLGQFSIIRLERDTQLLMPVCDYCIPEKECVGGNEDDPCTLFANIPFPVDEFFPPDHCNTPDSYRTVLNSGI